MPIVWLMIPATSPTAEAAEPKLEFNRDIRPILSNKCFRCHGPDSGSREAELRLDQEQDAKADRDGRPAIVPSNLKASLLIRRITSRIQAERMPPVDSGKDLTAVELVTLKRWVAEGAVWSLPWTYVSPNDHPTPEVRNSAWPLNWIDKDVLSKLEIEGIEPSPEADKKTLIRRLHIDLTGLPPTPTEVDTFVGDNSPYAYETLVDRLLASPHFGERMAAFWLDLVRFADTVGYHGDQEHNISPYRDYVINAFNANMPFDRFTREQLAGDLVRTPTGEQKVASGYNRLLQTSHEGGVQPKEYIAIYGADRVRNLSSVWMGATMGCCQCHDHKFDPYTIKDFYSMQAFFADIDDTKHFDHGVDRTPTIREPEMEVLDEWQRIKLASLESRLAELKTRNEAMEVDQKRANNSLGWKEEQGTIKEVNAQITAIHQGARRTMITVALKKPRETRVLPRGNWLDDSGELILPAIPKFLGTLNVEGRRATRLDLADWLTDAKHGSGGMTARVVVNRFWSLLFGRGLAAVLDDFGGQGATPSHPELLDRLAIEFVESGWDVKSMMKLIATSRAYRLTSRESAEVRRRDPLNVMVSHQLQFRFPAEVVRDSTLTVSGLLINELGGASVRPYQPAGYYRHLNFPEREYQADLDRRQWRRGVYMHWQRQYLHPMLKAFDAPSREECTAQRQRSSTPVAALVLLNDPTFVEAARSFAARILREADKSNSDRLNFAFRRAVSREPTRREFDALINQLERSRSEYAANPGAVEMLLSIGLSPVPKDLDHTDLAAWTIVSRTILSLNESLSRN